MKSTLQSWYLICLFLLNMLIIAGCINSGQASDPNNTATLAIKLNPPAILINDTATVTVSLESSSDITQAVKVTIKSDSKATILPDYSCQLTTESPNCTAIVQSGSNPGSATIEASSIGCGPVYSTLKIFLESQPGTLSINVSPNLALFNESLTTTVTLNDSVGIKTPLPVMLNGGNDVIIPPNYDCKLSSYSTVCDVPIKSSTISGNYIISASATGYESAITTLDVTNFKVLYMLESDNFIGASIQPSLLKGDSNTLYGTTYTGGKYNLGSIFQITTAGDFTILYSFYSNGAGPSSSLIQDDQGNLLGVTCLGGKYNGGIIFKFMAATSQLTNLASFKPGETGNCPQGNLVNYNGSLYGVTLDGNGTIFQFSFNTQLLRNLYSFTDSSDGIYPVGGLTLGQDGYLYGITESEGIYDYGTIFKFGTESGDFQTLFSFDNTHSSGANPVGALIFGNDNIFYGTTLLSPNDTGTVFSFAESGEAINLTSTQLDGNNGAWPHAGLVQTNDGNLYGTALGGGQDFYGAIFKFTPSSESQLSGQINLLYSFNSENGVCAPRTSLTEDDNGNLFGITGYCLGHNNNPITPKIFGFSPPSSN